MHKTEPKEDVQNPPIGSIIAFGGNKESIPDNWILCDGSPHLRKDYKPLFEIIGTGWGAGDGGTTFNVPDLRGQFLRGVTGDSIVDPDSANRFAKSGGNSGNAVGSYQTDAMQGHHHAAKMRGATDFNTPWNGMGVGHYGGGAVGSFDQVGSIDEAINDGQHGDPKVSGESRPVNAAVFYIIRAR